MPDASIFLVEDEALVRMSLASMVEELGHRVVAEAGTIKEAGAIAMTGVFDLAILDINIDGLGIDPVAHVIERRGLPFLFVTGYGAQWLPSLFRRRPVLEKPVSLERLKTTIDALLEKAASGGLEAQHPDSGHAARARACGRAWRAAGRRHRAGRDERWRSRYSRR